MKHVIFDLGNVLINFDLNVFYTEIHRACDQPLDIIESGYISEKLEALETGAITMNSYCKIHRFEWDLKWSPDDWANHYAKCYSPNLKGQEWFRRAREKGYKVSALSNLADFHRVAIDRTYPGFLGQFDYRFFSYEMGVAKPDEQIYRKVLETLGASPEDCLFLDDKPENIAGAVAVGMKGIVFCESNFGSIEKLLFS